MGDLLTSLLPGRVADDRARAAMLWAGDVGDAILRLDANLNAIVEALAKRK